MNLDFYKKILLINLFEEKIASEYDNNQIKTPVHLSVGQEALAVGVCSQLLKEDKIISTHRSHAHYIAKGGNIQALVDELYGKSTGCSGARGGSMHLIDNENGILGSTSIVGGTLPMATGAAFTQQYLNTKNVTVCFFGDGAAEEGVFHESLNFAALKKLPVIYVCENNSYAVFTPEHQRKNKQNIHEWGEKFGIEGHFINGNDVFEVSQTMKKSVDKARAGLGPTLIEAKTFLKYSHVGNKTDVHLGHKDLDVYNKFMENSPVNFLKKKLAQEGFTEEDDKKLRMEIETQLEAYFKSAQAKPDISPDTLMENVYSDKENLLYALD